MSDKLREIAEQEAQHAVGTVAWPYFRRLDAVTSAKEQDRLTGRFHAALQQARDLGREEAQAEVEQLRKALEGMVNCPVGGSGQRLPTPETVARARAALREVADKADPASYSSMLYWREKCYEARAALVEWIPRHSAACCMPDPGSGTFPPGPFLPKWCVCDDLAKRSRALVCDNVVS